MIFDKMVGSIERHPSRNTTSAPPMQKRSGMSCPKCGEFIPISMEEIIVGLSFICPGCGLKLDVDRTVSAKAIRALKKVAEERLATSEAEEQK